MIYTDFESILSHKVHVVFDNLKIIILVWNLKINFISSRLEKSSINNELRFIY